MQYLIANTTKSFPGNHLIPLFSLHNIIEPATVILYCMYIMSDLTECINFRAKIKKKKVNKMLLSLTIQKIGGTESSNLQLRKSKCSAEKPRETSASNDHF